MKPTLKNLFQFLKNSSTDQQGISPLKKNDQLHTDTKDKANMLNEQFQPVFTPLSPPFLKELSLVKVQDLGHKKVIDPQLIPEDMKNPTPVMPDIIISEAGIPKLLKNLNTRKAAGLDKIKPVVLQEPKRNCPNIENTL